MVFSVVMYECKSQVIRRPSTEELMLSNCGVEKTLESPLDSKEIKPTLKEISPEIHWKDWC